MRFEQYLEKITLMPFSSLVDLYIKEKDFLKKIDKLSSFAIHNGQHPFGNLQLRTGFSIESDELQEDIIAELAITENDYVVYPIESFCLSTRVKGVWYVQFLAKAPIGYHKILLYWADFIKTEYKTLRTKKKKKWSKSILEFCITLWYDEDLQKEVLTLEKDAFFEYLKHDFDD